MVKMMPHISVIIQAYNRKEYILGAFRSARRQTLSFKNYEIIVTKNFKDRVIDNYIERHGGKLIFFEGGSVGDQIADAVQNAKGRIICFLDDDDLFLRTKLNFILRTFQREPSLLYMHNNLVYINEEKKQIKKPNPFEKEGNFIIEPSKVSLADLIRLEDLSPGQNMSAISIKKPILINVIKDIDIIKYVSTTPDLILYLLALDYGSKNGGKLYISRKKLTKYRFHESTSISIRNYNSFRLKQSLISSKVIKNLNLIYSHINSETIRQYLKYTIKKVLIEYYFYKSNALNFRIKAFAAYLENFKYNFYIKPLRTLARGLILLSFISAPEFTRRHVFNLLYKH